MLRNANNLKQFLQINSFRALNTYFGFIRDKRFNYDKQFQHFYFQLLQKTKNLNTDKIAERIYVYLHNITQKPKCPICGKEVKFFRWEKGYNQFCGISCGLKGKYKNPQNLISANQKRIKTNIQKYGQKGSNINSKEKVSQFYNKQNEQYQAITELYSREEINQLLNTKRYNYKQYLGKGKVRKLKKDNLKLYKSIIQQTKKFQSKIKHYTFSASLLIAAQYNFDVSKLYCKCGSIICFDPCKPAMIENGYCKLCNKPGSSIEKYKKIYGDDYQEKWHEACKIKNEKYLNSLIGNKRNEGILVNNVSKISIQFFKKLYKKLNNKENIYTYFLNHQYMIKLTKQDIQLLKKENIFNKHVFYLDFYQNNKVIQFNGSYWHRNTQHEDELRKKILEQNHNMKVLFVDQLQYYNNEQQIINKCINFLQDKTI